MSPYFAFYKGKEEKLFPYYRNFRLFEFFLKVPPPEENCLLRTELYYILYITYTIYYLFKINLIIFPEPGYSSLSYPILSYTIISYPILSYPILSYPILSYPTILRGSP